MDMSDVRSGTRMVRERRGRMSKCEAMEVLRNYTCVCKYGTSPCNCEDSECDFGKAIRVLTKEAENDE